MQKFETEIKTVFKLNNSSIPTEHETDSISMPEKLHFCNLS